MTVLRATLLLFVFVSPALFATDALAQSVAGLVLDEAGAPAAGVYVEIVSPALIERSRTTLTDDRGRYQIDHLRPGTYTLRFSSQDRSRVVEGVELTGSLTVVVNATMAGGPVAFSIAVHGDRPLVDARSPTREVSLAGDLVRSLPTVRTYNALLPLVPGVVTNVNDVITGTATASFPIYGGRANEGRLTLNGFTVGSPPSGNSAASYVVDPGRVTEVTFTSTTALGESETSGLVMNIVSDSGGNAIRGSFRVAGSADALQFNNVPEALREQGATVPRPFSKLFDASGTLAGPVLRDRLWYFVNGRVGSSTLESSNVYYNLAAGDPAEWLYVPDRNRPSYSDRTYENAGVRLTWQVTPRHRVAALWDAQALCRTCTGATPGLSEPQRVSPEAVGVLGRRLDVVQASWSSPMTDRLLVEAGFGATFFGVGNFERKPNPTRGLVRVLEQCASGCAANGGIPGLVYRSQDFSIADAGSYLWKASVTHATPGRSVKVGYQHTLLTDNRTWFTNDQNLTYRFNNGVPNQLTQSISPWVNDARVAWQALFAEQQLTRGRLTAQGAVRFDRAWSWFPPQQLGPARFLPDAIVIPATDGVESYKDFTFRAGVAYDLLGSGRTVLRGSFGRYLEGAGVTGNYANTNPTLRLPQTTPVFGTAGVSRTWTDANGNYTPDCNLFDAAAQDLRGSGGDLCGALSNARFGQYVLTNDFDRHILDGWGVRPSDWNLSVSLQHQVGRGWFALTYTRRWFDGFFAVDNLALGRSDLTPFRITAPLDSRLPGGGGYVVSGLFDVVPEKFAEVDNFVTSASNYGRWNQHFDGVDATASVRAGGFTFVGGTSSGRNFADVCSVRASLPELATTTTGTSAFGPGLGTSAVTPLSPYCRVSYGLLTQFRGLSSYTVPKLDVELSAIFQSKPGPMLAALYAAPNSVIAPSLGRNLSGNAANATVNLIEPGTLYGDRINQLDIRVAKVLTIGPSRTALALETYNALNSSAVLMYNMSYVPGGPWLQPVSILSPRFLTLSAEVEF